MWKRLRQIRDTFNWGLFAYRLVVVLGLTGVVSAIGGAVWAVIIGVPTPIALMAGYCTLVGAVYLAMAPLAHRALAQSPANKPKREKIVPNYVAWRHLESYEIGDAAKLWSEIDPRADSTTDSAAWAEAFKAEVKKGTLELDYYSENRERQRYEKTNPTTDSSVTRASLKKFAKDRGHDPFFCATPDCQSSTPATYP
jgi:hypothetical protein